MIPVGIERDRRIAELRGEKEDRLEDYLCDRCYRMEGCVSCDNYGHSPYSTDIACAMELWEEMKGVMAVKLEAWSGVDHKQIIDCYYKPTPNSYECYSGDTEADTISGAWLKWKEATQ